jgi:CheY-like chemotaxis protein
VDDDAAVLEPMSIMLRRRGFQVLTATDGDSAVRLFGANEVHAVVLDYVMPGMNGGAVAQVIRQQDPDVPVILHTGYADIDDPRLSAVTCTLPKGSLSYLLVKLHDVIAAANLGRKRKDRAMGTAAGSVA